MDFNKWIGIGKVEAQPVISSNHGKKQAALILIVIDRTQDSNGQWVDVPIKVPLYALDKKADLIEKYVVAGQELTIDARYKSWDASNGQLGHGMIVQNVSFGFKPKGTGGPNTGADNQPPI